LSINYYNIEIKQVIGQVYNTDEAYSTTTHRILGEVRSTNHTKYN